MSWKSITVYLLLFAVVALMTYEAVTYFLSGQPLSILGFFTYIAANTQATILGFAAWVQDKLIYVIGGIGSAISGTLGIYKLVHDQVSTAKSQVQEAQQQTQAVLQASTSQIDQLKTQVTNQATAIQQKDQTITELQTRMNALPTQQTIDELNQKWQNDYTIMERTLQNEILRIKQEKQTVVI